jgi:hypothetical protein
MLLEVVKPTWNSSACLGEALFCRFGRGCILFSVNAGSGALLFQKRKNLHGIFGFGFVSVPGPGLLSSAFGLACPGFLAMN